MDDIKLITLLYITSIRCNKIIIMIVFIKLNSLLFIIIILLSISFTLTFVLNSLLGKSELLFLIRFLVLYF